MQGPFYRWLHRVWYEGAGPVWPLLPLSALYWLVVRLRRSGYRAGLFRQETLPVPVIVVGNITAGGTGKTPVTVWLARELKARGFNPGIVSRGYGGSHAASPMRVDEASDPAVVGDEPVLLARRSSCPVVVDRDRVRAAGMLVDDGADLVIADDGLQHLKLGRSYEICVIDGNRWLGNRHVLPAGPLREPERRIDDVDQVLVNGRCPANCRLANEQNALAFSLQASEVCRLNGSLVRPIQNFTEQTVHAVAAIGNPGRFFASLRALGMQVIEHPFPDHAPLDIESLTFADNFDILMTEKDAVKLGTQVADRFWYVPVDLQMQTSLAGPWLEQIESRMRKELDQA